MGKRIVGWLFLGLGIIGIAYSLIHLSLETIIGIIFWGALIYLGLKLLRGKRVKDESHL